MGFIVIVILSYILVFLLGFYTSRMVQKTDGQFLINYADPMKNLVSVELSTDIYTIEDHGWLLLQVKTEGVRPKLDEEILVQEKEIGGVEREYDVD